MSKLTIAARQSICEQLVEKAFGERRKAQKDALPQLVLTISKAWAGEHWDALASLPKEATEAFSYMTVNRRGGSHATITYPSSLPRVPVFHELGRGRWIGEEELRKKLGKSADKVFAWLDAEKALDAEINKFRSEVTQVLNSVTTYKRLHEVWPELKDVKPPVADENKPVPAGKMLAPCIKSLNAALGLK